MSKQLRFFILAHFLTILVDTLLVFLIAILINPGHNNLLFGEKLIISIGLYYLPQLLFGWVMRFVVLSIKALNSLKLSKLFEFLLSFLVLWSSLNLIDISPYLIIFLWGVKASLWRGSREVVYPNLFDETNDQARTNIFLHSSLSFSLILSVIILFFKHEESLESLIIILVLLSILSIWMVYKFSNFKLKKGEEVSKDTLSFLEYRKILYKSVFVSSFFYFSIPWFLFLVFNFFNDSIFVASLLMFLLSFSFGISVSAKLSQGRIELSLIPISALFISLLNVLMFCYENNPIFGMFFILLMPFFGGIYFVPISTLPDSIVKGKNRNIHIFLSQSISSGILVISCYFIWILNKADFHISDVYFILCGIYLVSALSFIKSLPGVLFRVVNLLITAVFYKTRVKGSENIPTTGGALIVCNNVSYIHPSVILSSISRPIRFIVNRSFYDYWLFKFILKGSNAIVISSKDDEREQLEAFVEARNALKKGEVLCFFASRGLFKNERNRVSLKKGIELITRGVDVPIIPFQVDYTFGGSYRERGKGKYFFKKLQSGASRVVLLFGDRISPDTPFCKIAEKIDELSSELSKYITSYKGKVLVQDRLIDVFRIYKNKIAVKDISSKSYSFIKLLSLSMILGRMFYKNIGHEKRIAILLPPSFEAVLASLGVLFSGSISVYFNYDSLRKSKIKAMKEARVSTVITSRDFFSSLDYEGVDINVIYLEDWLSSISYLSKLKYLIFANISPLFFIRYLFPKAFLKDSNDIVSTIYSNGSTGHPRAVDISHINVVLESSNLGNLLDLEENDVVLSTGYLYDSFNWMTQIWFPLLNGISVVYSKEPENAFSVGERVRKNAVSVLFTNPLFLSAYIKGCNKYQFNSLKYVFVGTDILRSNLFHSFREKFGISPFNVYGCAETTSISMITVIEDFRGSEFESNSYVELGYMPIPQTAVKVVDIETGEEVKPYNSGMIMVRGSGVMRGYVVEEEGSPFSGKWYITSDIGSVDENGIISVYGRLSRFSSIGADLVSHDSLEARIQEIVGIKDKRIVVIVGVPTKERTEQLVVLHTKVLNPDYVLKSLIESEVPNTWIPARQNFFLIDEVPTLRCGKLNLADIRLRVLRLIENAK